MHADLAFLLRGEGTHDGRLDERDKGHVGVGRDGHRPEQLGRELRSEKDI